MKKIICLFSLAIISLSASPKANAQDSRIQMAKEVQADLLLHRFAIAGDLYKINKFQLPVTVNEKAEEVFNTSISGYKTLFATLSEAERPLIFKEDFYTIVIPIVQYFRIPDHAQMMIQHRDRLHPKPEAPDPKHHEHEGEHEHN